MAFSLAGCARSNSVPAAAVPVTEAGPYTLDSGDQVRITVFGQPDLSGDQIVDGSGAVSISLLGPVNVRGLTVEQSRDKIARSLSVSNLLVNPSVNVQVIGFRPFFILGEVRQPGQFAYVEGMNVLTAVAIAGGFTPRADQNKFVVTRKVGDNIVEAGAQRNTPLRPGDVILVQERIF